jgi:hypothetical protein
VEKSEDGYLDKYNLNLDEASVSAFYEKLLAKSAEKMKSNEKNPEQVDELPYDLFVASVFYFRQLADDLCKCESDIDSNDS